MNISKSTPRTSRIKPLLFAAAVSAAALTTAGLGARQQGPPSALVLASTAHPPLPGDLSLYWFVPDTSSSEAPVSRPDAVAAARLAKGAQLVATKDYAAALPFL